MPHFIRVLLLAAALAASSARLHAQANDDSKPDPIEQRVKAMADKDPSTLGMVKAFTEGMAEWVAELNRVYRKLMSILPAQDRASLKKAEEEWIAFHATDLALMDAIYARKQGTMYRVARAGAAMDMIKQRAVQLRRYLLLVNGEGE